MADVGTWLLCSQSQAKVEPKDVHNRYPSGDRHPSLSSNAK